MNSSPVGPTEDWGFELAVLLTLVGGLEAMVCRLVTEDTCRAWTPLDGGPLLTVLAEVCRLNVDETAVLDVGGLACGADFKEVCDDDLFIFGGGWNSKYSLEFRVATM